MAYPFAVLGCAATFRVRPGTLCCYFHQCFQVIQHHLLCCVWFKYTPLVGDVKTIIILFFAHGEINQSQQSGGSTLGGKLNQAGAAPQFSHTSLLGGLRWVHGDSEQVHELWFSVTNRRSFSAWRWAAVVLGIIIFSGARCARLIN